jgi:PilZ domain-containing protein
MIEERRAARRYDLALPVLVRLPVKDAQSHSGQTRDISTRGVYFVLDREIAPGTELDFTLTLPAEITRGTEVFVCARGKVVRIDKHEDEIHPSIGVVAVMERYEIVRGAAAQA